MPAYVIGVDYGTNSVRSILFNCAGGEEMVTSVFPYPSGQQGILLDPKDHNLARQNPADYILGLETTIRGILEDAIRRIPGFRSSDVIGIGVDTTGSTPMPVDRSGLPLALDPQWSGNLAAHAWLWKDHTSADEALRITAIAHEFRPQYLAKCGESYSSEWFWSKIWHCLNTSPEVFDAAYSWVELADFVPALLAGVLDPHKMRRGVCAAGHKAMYCDEWDGLPDKIFLEMMDSRLAGLRDRLYEKAHDASTTAGNLCAEWAMRLGLTEGIPIAIGAFDAHYGAIGSGVQEGVLVKIIGTSTCDCTVASASKSVADIPGICGIVNGSILPGYYGIEAGQSAVGDIFKWFVEVVCRGDGGLHEELTREAAALSPGQSGLLALDWNNGNRNILGDQRLSGLLMGQTLHTTRVEIYRALIEATAYGARAIIDRLFQYGVLPNRIVCCGGIAEKNPMLMQIYADVTGCTMQISGSSQACALGAAISAAVAAGSPKGGYDSFGEAQDRMVLVQPVEYKPDPVNQAVYESLYALYRVLHDGFGGMPTRVDMSPVMKELIAIKEEAIRKAG